VSLLLYRLLFKIMCVLFLGGNEEFVVSLVVIYHHVYNLALLSIVFSIVFSFTFVNTLDIVYLSPQYLSYLRLLSESNQSCMLR
jgi:hypothetical protein